MPCPWQPAGNGEVGPVTLEHMCGIVGYVGTAADSVALDVVMEGLTRLEYRGYDSAGVALLVDGGVQVRKRAGKLANLRDDLAARPLPGSSTALGHTRWATHGSPTDNNAHPHLGGMDGRLALIHNGIIENFHQLKTGLIDRGVAFRSDTDTEVAAHLIAEAFDGTGDLTAAMRARSPSWKAPSRSSPCTPTSPGSSSARGATARWSSGSATARTTSAQMWPPSSGTPARRWSSRRTRSSRSRLIRCQSSASTVRPPRAGATTSTGTPRLRRRAASRASWPRRSTSSPVPCPTRCSAGPTTRAGWSSTSCASPKTRCGPSRRSSSSRAARLRMPGWSPSTPSSTGPASPARSSWRTSSATATRSSTSAPSCCRSASRGRPWTPSWRSSTRASSGR